MKFIIKFHQSFVQNFPEIHLETPQRIVSEILRKMPPEVSGMFLPESLQGTPTEITPGITSYNLPRVLFQKFLLGLFKIFL